LTPARIWRRLRGKPFGRLADLLAGLLMLATSAVGYLYAAKVPGLDPITIWPFWYWTVIFVALGLVFAPLLRWRRATLVVGFALLTGLLLNEEPFYLAREIRYRDRPVRVLPPGDSLRVITLNCGGGNEAPVRDALVLDPDVILLQESPGSRAIDRLLPEGWEHVGRIDTAVLVKGTLSADEHPRWLAHEMHVVRAVPERIGRPITLISTHLVQPSVRTDIWRPFVWHRAAMLRESRTAGVGHLIEQQHRYGDLPVVIGGDFNAGNHDSVLPPLVRNGFRDAFREAGRGWPNTITADYPMERIDYIWVDEHFEALRSLVAYTPHSDHRMVVADIALRQP